MSRLSVDAKLWLAENDPTRKFSVRRFKSQVAHKVGKVKSAPSVSALAVEVKGAHERPIQVGGRHVSPPTALQFIKLNVGFDGDDCLLMPFANGVAPRTLVYRGVRMSCSRVMCLLAHGTPPDGREVSRHLCGNGHLSCVNPMHLAWGSDYDNACDAKVHDQIPLATALEKVEAARLAELKRRG
jgi:hypothetical protein